MLSELAYNYDVKIVIMNEKVVSQQLVYGYFVYDTSSTGISSTDIWYTMAFLAE